MGERLGGVSIETVRQRIKSALNKLRQGSTGRPMVMISPRARSLAA
ncbi:MAG: sigma factor-like helix-turn-helix DNA-binding protein [Oscillospiraceae bacterium]